MNRPAPSGDMSGGGRAESLYRTLSLIRHFERKIIDVYMTDVMQTPVHLSIGQESIAAALCANLTPADLKIGTHRSHALFIANGGSPKALFAELLGRSAGCSGGWGGSMHVIDRARGLVGTSSIVGGALPIAVGLGMAAVEPAIAAVLFGDGAADQGVFAESLNFAALHSVPVVFLCANNRYSVYTPACQRRAAPPARLAESFGICTLVVPIERSSNVFVLDELLAGPIAEVRRLRRPLMVECHTVRALDHNGVRNDIAHGFRPAEEGELFETYDPLKVARAQLAPELAERIDAEAAAEVDAAYAEALEAPPAVVEVSHE